MLGGFPLAVWPLTFGSIGMLLLGLAAAAPIIIHLWSRRKYNEVAWAAMTYLLAAMRKNARRIQIEQLLLLAVRVLIVLALAFALADAAWNWSSRIGRTFVAGGGTTHTVLIIDGSYSMAYQRPDQERPEATRQLFETARQLAMELVKAGTQGDAYTLVLMSDPPRVIVAEPAYDPTDVVEEIGNLKLPHGGGDLPATLAQVQTIIDTAHKEHPRLVRTRTCFFSDLGRTTWDVATTDSDVRARIADLAKQASLVLVDLGRPGAENLAVTSLVQRDPYVTVGRDVTFQAQVRRFGSQDRTKQRVEFFVNGRPAGRGQVEVAASDEASVSFTHRFEDPGPHVVEARLGGDRLTVDDHRWISVPVKESIRALCVSGKQGSARYVKYALQPQASDRPGIRAEVVTEGALLERDLNAYDCVFLCNVGRFGRDEAGVLHDYLKSGGGLVFFLGDQVIPDSYNLELGGELPGRRVLPARIGQLADEAQYRFDPREYRHPIVDPFRGHQRTGLLSTPVWKYFKLQLLKDSQARVALWFEGGDPAIVEEPILKGRSMLVATAASSASVDRSTDPPTPWTAISSWPSFPPLVQEMLALAVSGRDSGQNLQVGQPLMSSIHSTISDVPLQVRSPDGNTERVRMTIDGEDSRWIYPNTPQSGVYRAIYGEPLVAESQWFAVNVNTRESDLARIDPELLPEQLICQTQLDEENGPAIVVSSGSGWRLFRVALGMLLVLLLLETWLAWLFGKSSA